MMWTKEDSENLKGIRVALEKLAKIRTMPSSKFPIEEIDSSEAAIRQFEADEITSESINEKLTKNEGRSLWAEDNLSDEELEAREVI